MYLFFCVIWLNANRIIKKNNKTWRRMSTKTWLIYNIHRYSTYRYLQDYYVFFIIYFLFLIRAKVFLKWSVNIVHTENVFGRIKDIRYRVPLLCFRATLTVWPRTVRGRCVRSRRPHPFVDGPVHHARPTVYHAYNHHVRYHPFDRDLFVYEFIILIILISNNIRPVSAKTKMRLNATQLGPSRPVWRDVFFFRFLFSKIISLIIREHEGVRCLMFVNNGPGPRGPGWWPKRSDR